MRILDVRDGNKDDIEKGQAILLAEIAHPSKTVMIIRGDGPEIAQFADAAAGRSDPFPWREVVWVKNNSIFKDGQEKRLFPKGNDKSCAVILDLDDTPLVWLSADSNPLQIEKAFLKAGSNQP